MLTTILILNCEKNLSVVWIKSIESPQIRKIQRAKISKWRRISGLAALYRQCCFQQSAFTDEYLLS